MGFRINIHAVDLRTCRVWLLVERSQQAGCPPPGRWFPPSCHLQQHSPTCPGETLPLQRGRRPVPHSRDKADGYKAIIQRAVRGAYGFSKAQAQAAWTPLPEKLTLEQVPTSSPDPCSSAPEARYRNIVLPAAHIPSTGCRTSCHLQCQFSKPPMYSLQNKPT